MKILMAFLLLLALLAMAAAGGHYYLQPYLQSHSPGDTSHAPGSTAARQSGPVDPNRLFETIPPLAGSPPPPAPLPDAKGGAFILEAPSLAPPAPVSPATAPADRLDLPVEPGPDLLVEPRFIDPSDLETPPEVLERRIVNRAKEILDKVPILPVPLADVPTNEQPAAPGR
ncbi:MAG: hypothetical protein HY657_09480 [Acidobacteria bacterium]|nr:hypothetical protein [Acidobacteriota bacterium]